MFVLASACLAGQRCRYDCGCRTSPELLKLLAHTPHRLICPETDGGLSAPRPPAEIVGGDGKDVLAGRAKVIDSEGNDLTQAFIAGAERTLKTALECGAERVYLKAKSPSCGCTAIYDGTFSGTLRPGMGVTAALLAENGIKLTEID